MNTNQIPHLHPLERRSGVPLYYQIQQRLMDRIRAGEFRPGQPIPSLQEIAAQLGVSQMTARQAIRTLCDLGVMYSKQGKGTFISGIKHERNLRQVLSFTEEMRVRGAKPSSRVLSFRIQASSREVRTALGLSRGQKVFRLRRVRLSDGQPMGIECSCLPQQAFPELLDTFDPSGSLYKVLAGRYGVQMAVTDEVVEVGKVTADEAALLKMAPGSPVFLFTRTSYGENGNPLEYVRSTYRGDRYKIVQRLTRAKPDVLATPLKR
ncbi:MAG: GntR family transcriptional regulator [Terracidiphilus sp.]